MRLTNSVKQLYRAPVRSLVWILALGLACGVASIGCGVYFSTQQSINAIKDSFTTIVSIADIQDVQLEIEEGHRKGLDTDTILRQLRQIDENSQESYASLTEAADGSSYAQRDRRELYAGYVPGIRSLISTSTGYCFGDNFGFDTSYKYCILQVQKRLNLGEEVVYIQEKPLLHAAYSAIYQRVKIADADGYDLDLELGENYLVFGTLAYLGNTSPSWVTVLSDEQGMMCYDMGEDSLDTFLEKNPEIASAVNQYKTMMESVDVLTCDDLFGIPAFNSGEKNVIDGRAFTRDETASGARVCLVSGNFADENRLAVGDTIDISLYPAYVYFFQYNYGVTMWSRTGLGVQEKMQTPASYEIIGLYSTPDWDCNEENFSPNTVIIPYASAADMPASMFGSSGLMRTWLLENDDLENFSRDMAVYEEQCTGAFYYQDQGYSEIQELLLSMDYNAGVFLIICLVSWAAVAALFLTLWFLHSRRDMGIMRSLGTGSGYAAGQILWGAVLLAAAAVLLGGLAATCLYGTAMDAILNLSYQQVAETLKFSDAPSALAHIYETTGTGSSGSVWLAAPGMLGFIALTGWMIAAIQSRGNARRLTQSEV